MTSGRRLSADDLEDLVDRADDAVESGDLDAAREALAQLPPAEQPLGDPMLALDAADLWLEVGDAAEARARYRAVTVTNPELADAWYGVGLTSEDLGDESGQIAAWKEALRLDALDPDDSDAALSEEEFAGVAERALGELPERARELLRDVPIVIVDRPSSQDVLAGADPRMLGMFEGTPYPDAGTGGPVAQLARILLFRRNLEHAVSDVDELREEIRTTLLHETGHFFGLDEQALGEAGLG